MVLMLITSDNATRGLIQLGQLSVTAGLYFSLGHSTIVIVAIAISTDVYDRIGGVSDVGGIIGAAVSASFLFIVALVNSIILARILKQRKRRLNGEDVGPENSHSLALRILGPVTKFVNRSWKMYPVGVLFGLGFDTASSIALLAVTALAQRGADGAEMPRSHIVILPLLFTAGMTLVDSADSVLMLYSYADFPEKGFALFESQDTSVSEHSSISSYSSTEAQPGPSNGVEEASTVPPSPKQSVTSHPVLPDLERNSSADRRLQEGLGDDEYKITLTEQKTLDQAAKNTMSGLSIILTLLSILVAFSISLITIMGLIGENCDSCREAAEDPNGGGLAGSWWRGWARANDMSGFIGAAVVGCFVVIVAGWYGGRWFLRRQANRPAIQL
ncbi:High-affinity nickel-transport protein, partial [Rhizoctonia solani]